MVILWENVSVNIVEERLSEDFVLVRFVPVLFVNQSVLAPFIIRSAVRFTHRLTVRQMHLPIW